MLNEHNHMTFEKARPSLIGLAYRLLGSVADAEDAVQEIFIKWTAADKDDIRNPAAWLTTICTRYCIDQLRAAYRSRVDYVGTWLPEPLQTHITDTPESNVALASSLTTAFLLTLERLSPLERAAYLLRDIFDCQYTDIAQTLEIREDACRKLVSRAKKNIGQSANKYKTPVEQQDKLLTAFHSAINQGNVAELSTLLASDVKLYADGGGKVSALNKTIIGKEDVLKFVSRKLKVYWNSHTWKFCELNGRLAAIIMDGVAIHAAISFSYDESGQACGIYIMRNPDKLQALDCQALN